MKLVFICAVTTLLRIFFQLLIPQGKNAVLPPSAFAENGTMPIAFIVYGIAASVIVGGKHYVQDNRN